MTPIPVEIGTCAMCGDVVCGEPVTNGWDFEYETTREEFSVVRCRRFQHLYLNPRPAAAAMHQIYQTNYYSFSESAGELFLVRLVRERLEARKIRGLLEALGRVPSSAIDIGCGDGRLLNILRRNGPADLRLDGIEISETAAGRARVAGFDTMTADLDSLEARDITHQYDLVFLHQVIEHLRSPRRALRMIREVLRPGGILSVETPDIGGWDARLFRDRHWGGYHLPRHFHLFNREALLRLFREEGYEIVRTRSLPSPVFWILSIRNRFIDRGVASQRLRWLHYQNVPLLAIATLIDLMQISTVQQSSNQQIWARRI